MNVYDLALVNGDFVDVEADFYERDDDDYVFFLDGLEVERIAWQDVMSVSKSTMRPRHPETTDHVWL